MEIAFSQKHAKHCISLRITEIGKLKFVNVNILKTVMRSLFSSIVTAKVSPRISTRFDNMTI